MQPEVQAQLDELERKIDTALGRLSVLERLTWALAGALASSFSFNIDSLTHLFG